MFTGLVEELGRVRSRDGGRFTVEAAAVLDDLRVGDSVALDGCCLTVVDIGDGWYGVDVVAETLARTTLGDRRPGDAVNLERPLALGGRLGGHLVQGHVDGVGEIVDPAPDLAVRVAPALLRYLVEKGSVAVDGCSLTVTGLRADGFSVAVVPHTAAVTTLGRKARGERVNVEVDLLAKYVESLLESRRS